MRDEKSCIEAENLVVSLDQRGDGIAEEVADVFPGLHVHVNPETATTLVGYNMGPAKIFRSMSDARRLEHRSNADFVALLLQIQGESHLEQDGSSCELRPGSFTFLDGGRTAILNSPRRYTQMFVQIPRSVARWLPMSTAVAHRLDAAHPLDRPLAEFMPQLWALAPNLAAAQQDAAIDALLSLIRLSSVSLAERPVKHVRVERALDFIDRQLGDSALSAEQVAAAQNVSRRYLDEVFVDTGRRVDGWIWERRLQRAVVMLCRSTQSVTAIGVECGFKSSSHFSRSFRSRFGQSPSDFRSARRRSST